MDAHRSSYTYCTRVRKRKFLVSDVQWSTGKGSISQYYLSDVPASPLVSDVQRPLLQWPTGPPTISQQWLAGTTKICKMKDAQHPPVLTMLALQKSVKWRMHSIAQSWPCWLALQFKTNLLNHENSKSHNKCLDRAEQQPHVFYFLFFCFFVMFCFYFCFLFFVLCFLFFVFCFCFCFCFWLYCK